MKVIGRMKDELCGTPILEFVSLRSKMYRIKSVDDVHDIKKQKALLIVYTSYLRCLYDGDLTHTNNPSLRSCKHKMHSITVYYY